ncbi:MAG: hypothetical protein ACREGJ_04305 [Candidatus Saccharimonadales bacterium]
MAVILSGAHVKDLVNLPADPASIEVKKAPGEAGGKASFDLHPHMDKQTFSSLVKVSGDNPMNADPRSLRSVRVHKKSMVSRDRHNHLFDSWWELVRSAVSA